MSEPVLKSIKNGWSAHGKGWAVHAPTQEEALQRFYEAEKKHGEVDARPFNLPEPEEQTTVTVQEEREAILKAAQSIRDSLSPRGQNDIRYGVELVMKMVTERGRK